MSLQLHGISNCDTVRKARAWLQQQGHNATFRDYKKQPPSAAELAHWATLVDWQSLLNSRGTTWRKLPPEARENIDQDKALALLQQHPSLIKRPLLIDGERALLGFKADAYQTFFS